MTLPQFWLAPLAYELAETRAATGLLKLACPDAAGAPRIALSPPKLPPPKVIWLVPPGACATRVVERPVMTLPQFWLAPLAYELAEMAGA